MAIMVSVPWRKRLVMPSYIPTTYTHRHTHTQTHLHTLTHTHTHTHTHTLKPLPPGYLREEARPGHLRAREGKILRKQDP